MRLNVNYYNGSVTVISLDKEACSYVQTDGGRASDGFKGTKKRDCVTRSISIILGLPYHQVWWELNEMQYEAGYDFNPDKGVITSVWKQYLEERGYKYVSVKKSRKYVTKKDIPAGKVILHTRGHLSACIDHVVHDAFDSRYKANKPRKLWGYVVVA